MSENQCRTCAGIKKELLRFWKWNEIDHGMGRYEISAIIDATYHDGIIHQDVYRNTIERQGSYRIRLNYCPECGARIRKRIREWSKEEASENRRQSLENFLSMPVSGGTRNDV